MDFPSPAGDYVERSLSPETICNVGFDSRILETSSGFAVIEPVASLAQGQVLLIISGGRIKFANSWGSHLFVMTVKWLTGALEETEVIGRVTYFINWTSDDEIPV